MKGNADSIANQKRTGEVVVNDFSPSQLRAPFVLRCAAALIDYLLIAFIPVVFLLFARFLGGDGAKLLNSELNNIGWLIAVLVAVANIVILPVILGQSTGKLIAGLRIVRSDGSEPTGKRLLLRQTVGNLIYVLTLGTGFIMSIFSSTGRSLNDRLFGTIVIQAQKKRVTK